MVVGDRRAGDVVVVGVPVKLQGVAGVGAGVGVRRVAHVNRADRGPRLAVHTGDRRDGRRVRTAVVGHGVRRDHDRRVGLGDACR